MANNKDNSYNVTFGGRGKGRGGGGRRPAVPGTSKGRGRGRGRVGRGRGAQTSNFFGGSSNDFGSFAEDEDDEICGQALGQLELEKSDVCQAFAEANAAEDLPGFDRTAGQIWIYPTNRPVRDYQFEIVKTALFNNTLVSLPTGLGKTFIAAVVMYNFHRWYPQDVVVFMAPTRPLVTQQLEACHQIVGISPSRTIEMTGQIAPKKREELWKSKSVFFLTPQVMTSDLAKGVCPAGKVRCVVVDEAHKALGQHAYAQVISMLTRENPLFRVLALSATPGSDLAAVQQVFRNLLIARVELRSEASPDLLPYIHDRKVDKIVVPLDDYIQSVHSRLMDVFQIYTGKLMKQHALQGRDGSSLTRFQLLKARESFRLTVANRIPNFQKGYIEVDFATCLSLAHSLELLVCHGLRTFYNFLQGVFNKEKGNAAVCSELTRNTNVQSMLTEIKDKLGLTHDKSTSFNSSSLFSTLYQDSNTSSTSLVEEDQTDYLISHPKMRVLKDIILKHFTQYQTRNDTTRVMIFSQYRDSCQEIGRMLATLGKLVKPMVFIGQASTGGGGKGLKQKDQVQVVQRFRNGGFNVLVSTCVGEEGLDIGEVDLIICFDASKSPTRLVQRMGRTGRQREGRIIFLLTKGKEERNYSAGFSLQNSISRNITDPSKLQPFLYNCSPRMVPQGVDPECFKMSVILTCEQERHDEDDDVITIDDNDDNGGDFLKPAARLKGPPKKKQATKSAAKNKKTKDRTGKLSSCSSNSSSSAPCSKTLTQCFEKLIEKSKKSSAIKSSENCDASVIVEEEVFRNDQFSFETHVDDVGIVMGQDQESAILEDIFDVVNPSTVVAKPCIYIPELPDTTIAWPKDFNDEVDKSWLLNKFAVECLRERLETIKLVTPFKEKCECGNSASQSSLQAALSQSQIQKMETVVEQKAYDSVQFNEPSESNTSFNMDEGFMFEDDDPFFEDDWDGETDNLCPDKNPIEDSSTTSNDDFGSPVQNIRNVCEVSQKASKPLSLKDDDDSSTSFEDNISPVVQRNRNNNFTYPETAKETQTQSKCRVDRNLFKDDLLLFESDEESSEENQASDAIMLEPLNIEPMHFSSHTTPSTPTKNMELANEARKSPTSPASDLSPDLSQFRGKNRIERLQQGDTDLLVACSQMYDPNDPNGKIVTVLDDNTWLSPAEGVQKALDILKKSPFIDKPRGETSSYIDKPLRKTPAFTDKPRGETSAFTDKPREESSAFIDKPAGKKFTFIGKPAAKKSTIDKPAAKRSPFLAKPVGEKRSQSVFSNSGRNGSSNRDTSDKFKVPQFRPAPTESSFIVISDDDDDFVVPKTKQVTHSTPKSASVSKTPSSEESTHSTRRIFKPRQNLFPSSPISSTSCTRVEKKPYKKRRKLNGNPFLDIEADVEDDSSSMDENDEFEGLDDLDDSFVVPEDDDDFVTDTQQIRYIRSVKDIEHVPIPRPEVPPPAFNDSITAEDDNHADFLSDSFCVANDDDVEFADIGVFTQAMNVAREQVRQENPGSSKRRQTRRHVRQKQAAMQQGTETESKKRRKRIIHFDSSDED